MTNHARKSPPFFLIIILFIVCFVTACMQARVVPPAFKGVFTRGYSEWELKKIAEFDGRIDELMRTWPIEYTYKLSTETLVFYVGNKGVTELVFNEDGSLFASHYRKWSKPLREFQTLQVGTDVMTVYELDPSGHYPLLFAGDPLPFSAHYTCDGYYVYIAYSSDSEQAGCIESISIESFFGFPKPE